MRPTNPRHTDANGTTWVTRSVVGCRKIPGFGSVDPLTLPFAARPSTERNLRALLGAADDAWRATTWATWTGTESEADALGDRADRLADLALDLGFRLNR